MRSAFQIASNDGLEWEHICKLALAVVLRCSSFRDLSSEEKKVVGDIPRGYPLKIVMLPNDIKDLGTAKTYLEKTVPITLDTLVFAYPEARDFHLFDALVFVITPKSKNYFSLQRGMQMKLGEETPGFDATADCPGVLLRGDPPDKRCTPRTRRHWEYLNAADIEAFLPFSFRPLVPALWRSPSSSIFSPSALLHHDGIIEIDSKKHKMEEKKADSNKRQKL